MSKKYNASMFDKIKDTLQKSEKTTSGSFSNIMKFPAGHTYTIRLIPDVEGAEKGEDKTFYSHQLHQWTSNKDGSFINALSLKTFGERDPINEVRWKLYKEWKDTEPPEDEKFDNPIKQVDKWLVNIYVVDDPANPENNGKVKILNMGPQLKTILDDAIVGERADEFGPAVFDLSKKGADFKIKAKKQGVFTTYIESYFTDKTTLDLSDEEIDAIYEQCHDLESIYPVKTADELQELLDEHFFCDDDSVDAPKKSLPKREDKSVEDSLPDEDEDDEIPMFNDKEEDSEVNDILEELDVD